MPPSEPLSLILEAGTSSVAEGQTALPNGSGPTPCRVSENSMCKLRSLTTISNQSDRLSYSSTA